MQLHRHTGQGSEEAHQVQAYQRLPLRSGIYVFYLNRRFSVGNINYYHWGYIECISVFEQAYIHALILCAACPMVIVLSILRLVWYSYSLVKHAHGEYYEVKKTEKAGQSL